MQNSKCSSPRARAKKSYYQYKNWSWSADGARGSALSVRASKSRPPDLINTCYFNQASQTETVYCIGFDLDAHRADSTLKTKKGCLKWSKIKNILVSEYPEIFNYIFAVVKSTSGKGLAIYLAISPLEITAKTIKAQLAAKILQEKLIILFNRCGFGADESAIGLKRDFCNWKNSERCVYENTFVLKAVQSSRSPVIKDLLTFLKPYSISPYIKKSERKGLLYPDIRAEKKLAVLYHSLKESWFDQEISVHFSVSKIQQLTGLSRVFVEKILRSPPKWLGTKYCGRKEGWSLSIFLDVALTKRSDEILTGKTLNTVDISKALIRPEQVADGQRNLWISKASLLLKHNGTNLNQAINILEYQVTKIPNYEESKNCKQVKKIVSSIYRNHPNLFSIKKDSSPRWLFDLKTSKTSIYLEKGGIPQKTKPRKVSKDQCFIFKKNYYSLPAKFINSSVLAFPWKDKLKIYEEKTEKYICTHKLESKHIGKYLTTVDHFTDQTVWEKQYLKNKAQMFRSEGKDIGRFAEGLIERYGRFSLRRLWFLQSLLKVYGGERMNCAASQTVGGSLYALMNKLKISKKITMTDILLI